MKYPKFFMSLVFLLIIFIVFQTLGFLSAQETITSVDGGTSQLQDLLMRYKTFLPLLLGMVFIWLRRKYFPSSHDKK